ncbi:hypothetical protein [Vallitalea guaymasensis]|uniref:hypothetical protein n=1 Tax=Vallitalea guaymasensis TaxID=1185412 RepID=UPI000DE41883|nr:hypothetical protein [Vallitalea guaymasensis]
MGLLREFFEEVIGESLKEGAEIFTDGFREMVIEGNSNYETSYEKRDRANKIISSARKSYERLYEEVKDYCYETERMIKEHYRYKRIINDDLLKNNKKLIHKFEIYDIKFDTSETHLNGSYNNIFVGIGALSGTFSVALNSTVALSSISIISKLNPLLTGLAIIDIFVSQRQRVEEANEYLEEAKDYRTRVNYQVEQLKELKSRLKYIRTVIQDEKYRLQIITKELKYYISLITDLLKRDKLDTDDYYKIKYYYKLSELVSKTLTTKFINQKGIITYEYDKLLNKLQKLSKEIQKGVS